MITRPIVRPITEPFEFALSFVGFPPQLNYTGPSLNLDMIRDAYSSGAIDQRPAMAEFNDIITFTRASTGTYFDSAGVLQTAAVDERRRDYDPVTLLPRGLLVEEQRTNLLTYSEQFDNAVWTRISLNITANSVVAPDGTLTADSAAPNAANTEHYFERSAPLGTETYTFSLYAKANGATNTVLRPVHVGETQPTSDIVFTVVNGVFIAPAPAARVTSTKSESVGGGWYRLSVTYSITSATTLHAARFHPCAKGTFIGDGTSGIYIWGAQLEAGSFPTSYIPTTTAQVTRAADIASVNVLSPWYNATEGTIVVEAVRFSTANSALYQLINTGSDRVWVRAQLGGAVEQFVSVVGAVNQAVFTPAAVLQHKSAFAYKENDFAASLNGGTVLVDTAGTVPSGVIRFDIGRDGTTSFLNGHIRSIKYYPKRLSNAELQALTI